MTSHRFSIWGTLIFSSIAPYDNKFFMNHLVVNKGDIEAKLPGMVTTYIKECYYYSAFKTSQNFQNPRKLCNFPVLCPYLLVLA